MSKQLNLQVKFIALGAGDRNLEGYSIPMAI